MRSVPVFLFTASILVLPSCGDDKDDSTSLFGGTADTTTGAVQPTSTSGVTSASTTAPDDTMTAGTSGSETSPTSGGSESSGEAGTTTDATTGGETTGNPVECAGLGQTECADNEACMVIEGGKLNLEKECVGKTMFFECVAAGVCGDAVTYACPPDADPPEPFAFPSTCLPADWQECEVPPIEMPCK